MEGVFSELFDETSEVLGEGLKDEMGVRRELKELVLGALTSSWVSFECMLSILE